MKSSTVMLSSMRRANPKKYDLGLFLHIEKKRILCLKLVFFLTYKYTKL